MSHKVEPRGAKVIPIAPQSFPNIQALKNQIPAPRKLPKTNSLPSRSTGSIGEIVCRSCPGSQT